jgi:hypothetical protein
MEHIPHAGEPVAALSPDCARTGGRTDEQGHGIPTMVRVGKPNNDLVTVQVTNILRSRTNHANQTRSKTRIIELSTTKRANQDKPGQKKLKLWYFVLLNPLCPNHSRPDHSLPPRRTHARTRMRPQPQNNPLKRPASHAEALTGQPRS